MPRLSKPQLFEKIFRAIQDSGWNYVLLSAPSDHPLRLSLFRNEESHKVRIYIWNLTHGGGAARPEDEYRIQITGVNHFESEPGGKTLILGWWDEGEVFAGFDHRRHTGPLGASPSMQIRRQYLREAYERGFSPCPKGNEEIAVAFRPGFFVEYVRVLEPLHDTGESPRDIQVLTDIAVDPSAVNDADIQTVTEQRRTAVSSVRRALRDSSFQDRVLTAYGHHCAVCSLQLDLVEAAHIVPVSITDSTDETSNGLALCVLHHRAYDRALIAVDQEYNVLLNAREAGRLREIGHDGGLETFRENLRRSHCSPSNPIILPGSRSAARCLPIRRFICDFRR